MTVQFRDQQRSKSSQPPGPESEINLSIVYYFRSLKQTQEIQSSQPEYWAVRTNPKFNSSKECACGRVIARRVKVFRQWKSISNWGYVPMGKLLAKRPEFDETYLADGVYCFIQSDQKYKIFVSIPVTPLVATSLNNTWVSSSMSTKRVT